MRFVALLCIIVVVCALRFNFLCFEVFFEMRSRFLIMSNLAMPIVLTKRGFLNRLCIIVIL